MMASSWPPHASNGNKRVAAAAVERNGESDASAESDADDYRTPFDAQNTPDEWPHLDPLPLELLASSHPSHADLVSGRYSSRSRRLDAGRGLTEPLALWLRRWQNRLALLLLHSASVHGGRVKLRWRGVVGSASSSGPFLTLHSYLSTRRGLDGVGDEERSGLKRLAESWVAGFNAQRAAASSEGEARPLQLSGHERFNLQHLVLLLSDALLRTAALKSPAHESALSCESLWAALHSSEVGKQAQYPALAAFFDRLAVPFLIPQLDVPPLPSPSASSSLPLHFPCRTDTLFQSLVAHQYVDKLRQLQKLQLQAGGWFLNSSRVSRLAEQFARGQLPHTRFSIPFLQPLTFYGTRSLRLSADSTMFETALSIRLYDGCGEHLDLLARLLHKKPMSGGNESDAAQLLMPDRRLVRDISVFELDSGRPVMQHTLSEGGRVQSTQSESFMPDRFFHGDWQSTSTPPLDPAYLAKRLAAVIHFCSTLLSYQPSGASARSKPDPSWRQAFDPLRKQLSALADDQRALQTMELLQSRSRQLTLADRARTLQRATAMWHEFVVPLVRLALTSLMQPAAVPLSFDLFADMQPPQALHAFSRAFLKQRLGELQISMPPSALDLITEYAPVVDALPLIDESKLNDGR